MGSAVKSLLAHVVSSTHTSYTSTPFHVQSIGVQHTHSHNHKEPSQESSQFHNAATPRVHEVIVRLRFAAYPVGHGRKHVGCDHEQGEEVVVEGGGEDNEDKSDGEDLSREC